MFVNWFVGVRFVAVFGVLSRRSGETVSVEEVVVLVGLVLGKVLRKLLRWWYLIVVAVGEVVYRPVEQLACRKRWAMLKVIRCCLVEESCSLHLLTGDRNLTRVGRNMVGRRRMEEYLVVVSAPRDDDQEDRVRKDDEAELVMTDWDVIVASNVARPKVIIVPVIESAASLQEKWEPNHQQTSQKSVRLCTFTRRSSMSSISLRNFFFILPTIGTDSCSLSTDVMVPFPLNLVSEAV